jgi:hypothetical protein
MFHYFILDEVRQAERTMINSAEKKGRKQKTGDHHTLKEKSK